MGCWESSVVAGKDDGWGSELACKIGGWESAIGWVDLHEEGTRMGEL